jgi:S-adenosylmethionine hydrolase
MASIVGIENPRFRLPVVSRTFHGRDILAPAAAHLANGLPLASLGPPQDGLAGDPFPAPTPSDDGGRVTGQVVYVDRFGNCITNIRAANAARAVEVSGRRVAMARAYGEVGRGEALALVGSAGFLEVAVRDGSAAAQLGIAARDPVTLLTS